MGSIISFNRIKYNVQTDYGQPKVTVLFENIYIFWIAMDKEEKDEVINEANQIYDVNEIFPSIYLASELSRNKL